jgi:FkbM family methyltransferase
LPTGLTFVAPIGNKFASEVLYTGANVDWGSEAFLARFADPTIDFLDIGAHVGYYAAYLAPLVRRVYAFEPDPRNFDGLAANLPSNALHVVAAVSAAEGPVHLDQTKASGEVADSGIQVEAITIDGLVARTPDINPLLMKLDIEGHEMAAIAGMADTVARFQPLLLIEFAQSDVNTPQALVAWLDRFDYTAHAFTPGFRGPVPPALDIPMPSRQLTGVKMIFLCPPRLRGAFEPS